MLPEPLRSLALRAATRRGISPRWVGVLACAVLGAAPAAAQGVRAPTPDTLRITNTATLTYKGEDGVDGKASSSAQVVLEQTAGVALEPPREAVVVPGSRSVFAHRLTNVGTGQDRFVLEAAGPAGWSAALWRDVDGDGALGPRDVVISGPLALGQGESAAVLAVVDAPANAADRSKATVGIKATSLLNAAATTSVSDILTVHLPVATLSLGKTVDRPLATSGDTLTYTLAWANHGDGATGDARLDDPLPEGLRFVPGSLVLAGHAVTDSADADAGSVSDGAGRQTVHLHIGPVAPGDSATASFRATIGAGAAAGALRNVARVTWDSVAVESPTTVTSVRYPSLQLRKERTGADTVRVGGEVGFRLSYANLSADVAIRDLVLVDSLPGILSFVSASIQPEVDGQVLRWHLGTLAPGGSGVIELVTRAGMPAGGQPVASVINRVTGRGANVEAVSAVAAAMQVAAFKGDELKITKSTGVLEAGPGDAIPYVLTLRNAAAAPLQGIEVRDELPANVKLVQGSLQGADSMRVSGRDLRIWWAGPLPAGGQHVVRYGVVVLTAGRGSIANRAWARAEGGAVRSDTAVATVRARRGFAMQQRSLVGKVWIDLNDDGRQQPGEPGAAGVEIWSADGQVVTTDREGRYSIADIQPGTQLLRLDTVGVARGYVVAGRGGDQRVVRMDGWTLPEANFRLVPRPGFVPPATTTTAVSVDSIVPAAPATVDSAPLTVAPATSAPLPERAAADAQPPVDAALAACPVGERPSVATLPAMLNVPARRAAVASSVRPSAGGPSAAAPVIGAASAVSAAMAPARTAASAAGSAARTTAGGSPASGSTTSTASAPSASSAAAPVVTTASDVAADSAARVQPLRTAAEREAEKRGELLGGPSVQIFAPADGAVVGTNRVYVGVRGEPGAAVQVFDGGRKVGEANLRPDGVMDFVGIELAPGPHRLRVEMKNSWGTERWDSVAVHRSGDPVRIEALPAPVLHADARDTVMVAARVLDQWGVPLANRPRITVEGRGATLTGTDADASSVGFQVAARADGTVAIPVVAGHSVGPGEISLASGKVHGRLPLRVFPSTRSLFATGIGQVGVGAAPEAFGAVTVRGALGSETSLSVSYDSRRSSDNNDFFARGYDPLDESRYPTLGDGSDRRVLSASTQSVSARLERGFDWLELGDINTSGFGGGAQLGGYQRSLTGVGARVATGAVVWRAFGSLTDQALVQRQLRGDGTSGPYKLGSNVRPGTDIVAVEIRARENAARVISRVELQRFVDYQIDYVSGEVLLERPVPAATAEGDPVYVVATVESRSGGKSQMVGGLRMEVDARRWLRSAGLDSLGLGVYGVRDAAENGLERISRNLAGADVRLRRSGLEMGGELMRSASSDSSALASHADVSWTTFGDRARLGAEWMHVGQGFSGSADPRLSSGLQEIRLSGEVKVAEGSTVRLTHERERFDQYGVERHNTRMQLQQSVLGRTLTAEGGMASDVQADASSSSAVGKISFSPVDRVDVWVEGTRNLDHPVAPVAGQAVAPGRPNEVGAGLSLRVLPRTRLDLAHRWVSLPGDTARGYQLTEVKARTEAIFGGQVYGGLERADDSRARNYLALGWDQHLQLQGGWAVSSLFERRFGVSRAALSDPNRALPFPQAEPDRWSAGLGLDWVPADGRPRFSAHGEMHDGRDTRGHRLDLAGDAPLGISTALLGRSEWLQQYNLTGNGLEQSRRDRSLLGLAFRPVGSEALNALAKVEWRRSLNPLGTGGVLGTAGEDRRLIGSTDLVWTPRDGTELAARYALRWTLADPTLPGVEQLGARAQFMGLRLDREVRGPVRVRMDGRLLTVGSGNAQQWSAAPALVVGLGKQLEVEGGYRFGNLLDPDFAADGHGLYATLGFHFSEGTFGSVADFWRKRIQSKY